MNPITHTITHTRNLTLSVSGYTSLCCELVGIARNLLKYIGTLAIIKSLWFSLNLRKLAWGARGREFESHRPDQYIRTHIFREVWVFCRPSEIRITVRVNALIITYQ
jgi:hypothetical protein